MESGHEEFVDCARNGSKGHRRSVIWEIRLNLCDTGGKKDFQNVIDIKGMFMGVIFSD